MFFSKIRKEISNFKIDLEDGVYELLNPYENSAGKEFKANRIARYVANSFFDNCLKQYGIDDLSDKEFKFDVLSFAAVLEFFIANTNQQNKILPNVGIGSAPWVEAGQEILVQNINEVIDKVITKADFYGFKSFAIIKYVNHSLLERGLVDERKDLIGFN